MERNFRMRVARQLLDGESLPALTKRRAEATGFRAFEPIEDFLNSVDASFRERPKAREEEALEALGLFSIPPVVETLYQSPFLNELRTEQARTGANYRKLSHDDELSRLSDRHGINSAFARGEQVLKREAAQAVREPVGLTERLGLSWFRTILRRNLSLHGFARATALEKSDHLVFTRELGDIVLTFAFDTRRRLQHRFLISPKTTISLDILSRSDSVAIGLERTSFALMAGGRPYLTPNDGAECDWCVRLLCLAVDLVAERLGS